MGAHYFFPVDSITTSCNNLSKRMKMRINEKKEIIPKLCFNVSQYVTNFVPVRPNGRRLVQSTLTTAPSQLIKLTIYIFYSSLCFGI